MRLYEVVSLLLCSWKAEVYINGIYDAGASRDSTTIWKTCDGYFSRIKHKHVCLVVLFFLLWLKIQNQNPAVEQLKQSF